MSTSQFHLCRTLFLLLLFASSIANAQLSPPVHVNADCRVKSYGASGDGHTLDTRSINAAIEDCHSRGGGTVVVEAGIYRTGTLRLLDNITLKLEPGATILGSENLNDYPRLAHASEDRDTALIVAEHAHNIAIIGTGTIDGNGRAFMDANLPHFDPYFEAAETRQGDALVSRMRETREGPVHMRPRPGVLMLVLYSDGITLRDLHVIDSPNWGVKLMCSDHILVSGLDVRNNLMVPNNDALDISGSRNATISDSSLEAGDDALVVGGPCADGWCQLPAENITVSNVILRSRSAAIRIGPAAKDVRNLIFNNVIIRDSNRGINIQARAGETVENLIFSNIVSDTRLIDGPWWGSGEPISITVARWSYPPWPDAKATGRVRHLKFSNMIVKTQSPIVIYSMDPGHIEDVEFRDLTLTMQASPLTALMGGNLDLQPTTPISLGVIRQDLSAVQAHNVNGLAFHGLQVHWEGEFPSFYRQALHVDGFDGLTIDDFEGQGSALTYSALELRNGKNFSIRDSRSLGGPLLDSKGVIATPQQTTRRR